MKRKREKSSNGLRLFSLKVCEKVKEKVTTTYSQVADELVDEYCKNQHHRNDVTTTTTTTTHWSHDQKNVRRRVYDALNVLMAMKIIWKEKKAIRWIGLPRNQEKECEAMLDEKARRSQAIRSKSQVLQDLIDEVQ